MNTNLIKLNVTAALIALATGISAQTTSPKKTCIKINEIINGKEKKIDTCFTGMTEEQINSALKTMGFDGMVEANGSNDKEDGKTYAYAKAGKDDKGTTTEVSVTASTNEDGKEVKEVKVWVHKKVEVKDMTEEDKKTQPANVSLNGSPFSDLLMYPNPTENSLTISYTTTSFSPLVIYIYDVNGKSVYMETVKTPDLEVKKTISLESLGAGVYFVHLTQDGHVETKKIVVK